MAISTSTGAGGSGRRLLRSLLPLGTVVALGGVATSLAAPFLAVFLSRSLQVGPVQAAVFLFLTPLSAVLASTVLGRLSDRPGMRRPLLITAAASGCCGYAVFAVAHSYWLLLAVMVTVGAASGSIFPQTYALARRVLDASGSTRAPIAINSLRTLLSAAWVVGPPAAGALLAAIGFTGLFAVTSACFAAISVVVVTWIREPLPDTTTEPPHHGPATSGPATSGPATDGPSPTGAAPVVSVPLATLAFVALQTAASLGTLAMPLFVSGNLHGSVRGAGGVLGLCAALEIPLMVAFGMLASRIPLHRLVLAGGCLGTGYYALVTLATTTWQVAAAQLLNACFISAVTGLGISYFQDLLPRYPGRATALFTNTNRISAMLAGPCLGVAQHFGYRLAYGTGAVLCATGLVLLALAGTTPRLGGPLAAPRLDGPAAARPSGPTAGRRFGRPAAGRRLSRAAAGRRR